MDDLERLLVSLGDHLPDHLLARVDALASELARTRAALSERDERGVRPRAA